MKNFLRLAFFSVMLLSVSPVFAAQVSLGIRIGPPPQPRVVRRLPPSPGSDFVWIDGYWYPQGNHYRWHDGYWTRAPYGGARWIGPRYEGISTIKAIGTATMAASNMTTAGTVTGTLGP